MDAYAEDIARALSDRNGRVSDRVQCMATGYVAITIDVEVIDERVSVVDRDRVMSKALNVTRRHHPADKWIGGFGITIRFMAPVVVHATNEIPKYQPWDDS